MTLLQEVYDLKAKVLALESTGSQAESSAMVARLENAVGALADDVQNLSDLLDRVVAACKVYGVKVKE